MKVLITGGAGFIGSNYVYYHLEKAPQDELFVLDALTYAGHRDYLKEAEAQGVRFIQGRIEDSSFVRELFETEAFDLVVNFAAETHVDRSIEDPSIFLDVNIRGTQVLLDASRDFGVKRFHQISTDEVYGDLGLGSTDQFTESSPLRPSNPYAVSKAAADLLCLSYLRTFGVPVSISRCSNNYGPYQDATKLIPFFTTKALKNEPLPLYGTGENVRDWLYVRDHCEAVFLIVTQGRVGEIYNVGGQEEQANISVTREILHYLGKPESLIEFVEDRKGHDERYAVSYEKLQKELGWQPRTSFKEGMHQTLDWYTLEGYERSYSRWRNRISARATDQSHKQAPAAGV